MTRTAIPRKRSKPRRGPLKDPKYLKFVASLHCAVCCAFPVEVAHVGERGLGQKCSDRETIPLCALHHRVSSMSHHSMGKKFWDAWGLHRDRIVASIQRMYEEQH